MVNISVVIPTYNSADLVCEAIESVLNQSVLVAEVIVVDDGSTDGTDFRLKVFGDRIRYIRQDNSRVAAARNRGLREATGEVIAFLDADDVWHPDKLRLQLGVLSAHPDIGLLGTNVIRWPGQFPTGLGTSPVSLHVVKLNDLVVKNYFTASSILVRRSVVDAVGEFDRSLNGPEDYDFWLRAARHAQVANLSLPLTGYRYLVGSLSKHALSMEKGMRIILGKLEAAEIFRGRPLLRLKSWSFFYWSCAQMHGAAGNRLTALWYSVLSLTVYPFPLRKREIYVWFARPRLFVSCVRRYIFSRS